MREDNLTKLHRGFFIKSWLMKKNLRKNSAKFGILDHKYLWQIICKMPNNPSIIMRKLRKEVLPIPILKMKWFLTIYFASTIFPIIKKFILHWIKAHLSWNLIILVCKNTHCMTIRHHLEIICKTFLDLLYA